MDSVTSCSDYGFWSVISWVMIDASGFWSGDYENGPSWGSSNGRMTSSLISQTSLEIWNEIWKYGSCCWMSWILMKSWRS